MTSKYYSCVFVTFLLLCSSANANPIGSFLQLPTLLGNVIAAKLPILNRIPIISDIISAAATTTQAPTTMETPTPVSTTPVSTTPVSTTQAITTVAVTEASAATAGGSAVTSTSTVAVTPVAPVSQSPTSSAAAPQPTETVGEAPNAGDVTATGISGAATEAL